MITQRIIALAATLALFVGPALGQDAELGQKVYKKNCFACHKVGEGARNLVGPVLNNLIGRTAGTVPDFKRYSDAMKAAGADGLVWSQDTLRAYLPAPREYVEGTTMTFIGLAKPEDIENLIAYLTQFSPNDGVGESTD